MILHRIRATFRASPEPLWVSIMSAVAFALAVVLLIYAWEMLG